MNYIDNDILIVSKEDFSQKTLKKLTTQKSLKITGDYKLTKEDYDNILLLTNVQNVEVEDIEDFEYDNEIEIKTNKNIEFKTESYKKLKINKTGNYNKTSLTLTIDNDTEEDFNKLLKHINNLELLNINLEIKNTDKIIEMVYKIENKINKKLQFVNVITQNQTINEIEKLRFLEDDRIIKIWYEDGITDCSVDEFITMRKNIDLIVNEIKEKNLSNLERIIYAYDIVKKYNYKGSNNMDGRQLHKIFTTDNLVCSGYSRIISQVLEELNIQSGIYKLMTKDNVLHARSFVHIVDDKYNVDALYSMEPTWESKLNEDFAYSMFLTPITKLKQTFPNETFREDIDVLCGEKKLNEISLRDKISLYQFFKNKDLTQQEVDDVINKANKEVTLNAFSEALINVKTCEGLKRNVVELNVPKIIKYNTNLINYINNNIGTKIEFFK